MNLRSCVVVIGIFFLFFVFSNSGNIALAQDGNNNQSQPPMSHFFSPNLPAPAGIPMESFDNQVDLRMYEAAAGDLSSCEGDSSCLKHAKDIRSWLCAANVCDGTDKSKEPVACFEISHEYSAGVLNQIDPLICPVIKSPSTATRRALLVYIQDDNEDSLVANGAYLLALKGSAPSCEDYIKSYVVTQWDLHWYEALSGCRILAHESTRDQEENDLKVLLGVSRGFNNCSGIVNSELRNACNSPGTKFL